MILPYICRHLKTKNMKEELNLIKSDLRTKLEHDEQMTELELLRLNAHNINGIRIIVNTIFIITFVVPAVVASLYWLITTFG